MFVGISPVNEPPAPPLAHQPLLSQEEPPPPAATIILEARLSWSDQSPLVKRISVAPPPALPVPSSLGETFPPPLYPPDCLESFAGCLPTYKYNFCPFVKVIVPDVYAPLPP